MKGSKMCWNLAFKLLTLIILTLCNSSEARNVKHLQPSAVIMGTVFCDTCFQDDFSRSSHFISGATVTVECKDAAFEKEVRTDEQGKFKVHLPFSISKHEKEIKGCQVRLVKSSEPYCAVASTATSSSIHLKSRKQGTRVFSAGFFTFKPLKQPDVCNQQPSINPSTKVDTKNSLLDPVPGLPTNPQLPTLPKLAPLPSVPGLPTNPQIPTLPKLAPLPSVPGLPTEPKAPPKGLDSSKESIARPQFFFPPVFPSPPPAIGGVPLPPNPLQPPPLVPFPLPPNPLQPPSPPSFGLPPIPRLPSLIPSPPPPPPVLPGLPIPPGLPRLPIPPGLPGLPIPPVVPGVPPVKKLSP